MLTDILFFKCSRTEAEVKYIFRRRGVRFSTEDHLDFESVVITQNEVECKAVFDSLSSRST